MAAVFVSFIIFILVLVSFPCCIVYSQLPSVVLLPQEKLYSIRLLTAYFTEKIFVILGSKGEGNLSVYGTSIMYSLVPPV